MLVTMKEILDKARDGGYAVAAPNVFDQYTILAALEAAEETRSPIILDFGERDGDIFTFAKIALPLIRDSRLPAALPTDISMSFSNSPYRAFWGRKAHLASIHLTSIPSLTANNTGLIMASPLSASTRHCRRQYSPWRKWCRCYAGTGLPRRLSV